MASPTACSVRLLLLLASLLSARAVEQSSGTNLVLYSIDTVVYPEAVCNDNSPSGVREASSCACSCLTHGQFYFAPATDPDKANLWLVYLQVWVVGVCSGCV